MLSYAKDWMRIQPGVGQFATLSESPMQISSSNLRYHLYSIWLFTRSDLKTIVVPSTVFAAANAWAIAVYGAPTTHGPSSVLGFGQGTLRSAFWTWSNLLPFAIDNQRRPDAVAEDAINKPWRTLPSQRLSLEQAKWIMLVTYALAILDSLYLGGVYQCLALVLLGFWYNTLGGSDTSAVVRNFINACGFIAFGSGALEVHLGRPLWFTPILGQWLVTIAAVVFTTVQTQDLYAQPGDALRGRKTLPLEFGDGPARRFTTAMMLLWSALCPWFWSLRPLDAAPTVVLGCTVAWRVQFRCSIGADRTTFKLWNLWIVGLYVMPLIYRVTQQ